MVHNLCKPALRNHLIYRVHAQKKNVIHRANRLEEGGLVNEDRGRQNQGEQSLDNLERHCLWTTFGVARRDRVDNGINQRRLMTALSRTALSTIRTTGRRRRGGEVGTR